MDELIYGRNGSELMGSVLRTAEFYDGNLLADLLSINKMMFLEEFSFDEIKKNEMNNEENPWQQIVCFHLDACRLLLSNEVEKAFLSQSKKMASLLNIFESFLNSADQTSDENIYALLPVFNRISHELRLLAILSNDEQNDDGNDSMETDASMSGTIQVLNRQMLQASGIFQRFPSANKFRKIATLIISNQTIKLYYALEKYNLCRYSLLKAGLSLQKCIEDEKNSQDVRFCSHVVTHRYFLARNLLLENKYQQAIEHFQYVFDNCIFVDENMSIKNKQRSLLYLVVLKMLYGEMPKIAILEKYELFELIDLIKPVQTGSLKLLIEKIQQHEKYLFERGIFFLVENFKLIAIRNLLRLTINPQKEEQLDRVQIETTLLFIINFGLDQDQIYPINEVIDILNCMIQRGMIKGYISYKFRLLVFSRRDPFPRQYCFTSLLHNS